MNIILCMIVENKLTRHKRPIRHSLLLIGDFQRSSFVVGMGGGEGGRFVQTGLAYLLIKCAKLSKKGAKLEYLMILTSYYLLEQGFRYRKDTEPLYHSFVYSLVSLFFPVSIHYMQYIHCLLHQMLEICNRHYQKQIQWQPCDI